jgi:hypothetical protein
MDWKRTVGKARRKEGRRGRERETRMMIPINKDRQERKLEE